MEIQLQSINKLHDSYLKLQEVLTPEITSFIDLDLEDAKSIKFQDSERELLYNLDDKFGTIFPENLFDFDISNEIELNVVTIENENQLERYLKLIRNKINTVFELLISNIDFNNYPLKYWGDIVEQGKNDKDFHHPTLYKINNPAINLKVSYLRVVEQVAVLRDQIDSRLNPGKDFTTIAPIGYEAKTEIKAWRLIIEDPKRREFFDKWTAKMKEVREKVRDSEELINAINSSGYFPGSGNKKYDDVIEWGSHLDHILPDRVFTYEIMNEIDHNMLDLKTSREKDLYLSKLAGELEAAAHMFSRMTRTHPEYKPLEEELRFNEDTQESYYVITQKEESVTDWRRLKGNQKAYALQMFYIHLIIISNQLSSIVDYADRLRTPEDTTNFSSEEVPSGKRLVADRHKLILLQKTGVFKFLTDKFMNPKQPLMIQEDFKRLIENMIGATTKDIGSDVAKLLNENIDPKKNKTVETPGATKSVNAFLSSLGLTV